MEAKSPKHLRISWTDLCNHKTSIVTWRMQVSRWWWRRKPVLSRGIGVCGWTLLLCFIIQSFFLPSDPIQSTLVLSNHFNCLQSPTVKFPCVMAGLATHPYATCWELVFFFITTLKPAFSRLLWMFCDYRGQSMISASVLVTLPPFLVFQELINCCS